MARNIRDLLVLLSSPSFRLSGVARVRYFNIIHDLGHFLTACLFALCASWVFGLSELWSTIIGTAGLPLVQETHDYFRYRSPNEPLRWPSKDSLHDPGTYQLLWTIYFFQAGGWLGIGLGFAVIVAYTCYIAWYHIGRTGP